MVKMQKICNLFIICLLTLAFDSFCQTLPISGKKNNEAMILYNASVRFSGAKMIQADTLFVRNSLILEPIKTESTTALTNTTSGNTKTISTRKILQWYYITDISKMIGMSFNVQKQSMRKNIKTFTSNSKDLGYGMSVEPFLFKDGYNISDYSKVGDTIFNGQKCIVIQANRKIPVINNSIKDDLLFTRIFINPLIKDQNYLFISDLLTKHFGGAIVFAQSGYQSGVILTMNLEYKPEITPAYRAIFDKYQALYLSNIALLDKLKK